MLATATLLGAMAVPAFAVGGNDSDETVATSSAASASGTTYDAKDVEVFMSALSYVKYDERYSNIPATTKEFTVEAVDYDKDATTANVEVYSDYEGMEGDSLLTPNSGSVAWKINVPESARYAIEVTYFPVEGTYTTIERMMYIDGTLPFAEARYFYFPRAWEYEDSVDGSFKTDANGNDIRPIRYEAPEWTTYYMRDWLGYTMEPFEVYMTEGEHTITFEAAREPMLIKSIRFYRYEEEQSYDEFLEQCKQQGITEVSDVTPIKVQAENPTKVSNASLFPTTDRTSVLTEPQDSAVLKYNILTSNTVNHWMRYTVNVEKSGLYRIDTRFRENDLIGMFVSRRVLINGEVQYKEANYCRFKYSPDWQYAPLNDGQKDLLFYLEEGENTITFEIVLGDMTDYVYEIEQMIDDLNGAYTTLLMVTGPTPDNYRDYGFSRIAPEAIKTIRKAGEDLHRISDELLEITGEAGDQIQALQEIAILLDTMAGDEYKIAGNFVTFKNYIIALSNWLYAQLSQPMKLDYFVIQAPNAENYGTGKAGFFESAWFEMTSFVKSFVMDYTTIAFEEEEGSALPEDAPEVEMWITNVSNRDDALVQRNLIDTYFTPNSGIKVTIKIITAGLTEAILAGIGPDVSDMTSVDAVTWGLRNAVENLKAKDENGNEIYAGFEDLTKEFDPEVLKPVAMKNQAGIEATYGVPTTMDFNMMFYRSDTLSELGLKVPDTWDDLYSIMPALQNNNMQACLPTDPSTLVGYAIFLYQSGLEMYVDNGYMTTLDSNQALSAFESYCDMFTKYGSPVVVDVSRFRTGENPILIAPAIATYNTLMTYYELRGLWEMAPLPATEREDGTLDCSSVVTVNTLVIPRGAEDPQASWEYIKWYTCKDTQLKQAKEQVCVSANPTIKYSSANSSALLELAWTDEEYKAISTQLESLAGIPEYPGNYLVTVQIKNAFYDAYNNMRDPSDALLDRVVDINKEISRKRKEFGLDYYEISYSGRTEGELQQSK